MKRNKRIVVSIFFLLTQNIAFIIIFFFSRYKMLSQVTNGEILIVTPHRIRNNKYPSIVAPHSGGYFVSPCKN